LMAGGPSACWNTSPSTLSAGAPASMISFMP
jgi:hypothetical protein